MERQADREEGEREEEGWASQPVAISLLAMRLYMNEEMEKIRREETGRFHLSGSLFLLITDIVTE